MSEWYRGPWSDWIRAVVVSVVLVVAGWLSFQQDRLNQSVEGLDGMVTAFANMAWGTAVTDGLPYAVALVPVVLLVVRWYYAGEPLPESVTNRSYNVYLVGTTALQVVGGVVTWSLWIYALVNGTKLKTVLMSLPTDLVPALAFVLFISLSVGLIGPPVFMYLDARYLGDTSVLSPYGSPYLLPALTLFGVQFVGIPTVLAVYWYLSRRDRNRVEHELLA